MEASCLEEAVFERLRQLLTEKKLFVRQEGASVALENAQVHLVSHRVGPLND